MHALQQVGLEIHGGLSTLIKAMTDSENSKQGISMLAIHVKDAEKARKYLEIGIRNGTDIPKDPSTLEAFTKVSGLVKSTTTTTELEGEIAATSNKVQTWVLQRELFPINTNERYRQILLDMARET